MKTQIVRIVVWVSVAIAAAVVLYIRFVPGKVRAFENEANALIGDGNALKEKLGPQADQILNGTVPREYASDRAKLEDAVARIDGLLVKIVEDYRAAAAKFDEGKKASKNDVVAKYLDLMSQAYRNRSDAEESRRKIAALLLDKSVASDDERRRKGDALKNDVFKSEGEFERLDEEASQLRDENKSSFSLGKM